MGLPLHNSHQNTDHSHHRQLQMPLNWNHPHPQIRHRRRYIRIIHYLYCFFDVVAAALCQRRVQVHSMTLGITVSHERTKIAANTTNIGNLTGFVNSCTIHCTSTTHKPCVAFILILFHIIHRILFTVV